MTTTLSYEQAIAELSQNPNLTIAELKNLVSRVSVDVSGAKSTLLYSGTVDNVESWRVAESIGKSNVDIVTIGKTDVSKLLNKQAFIDIVTEAAEREGKTLEEVIEGKNASGTRITNDSMCDIASKNLAQNASGDIVTISATAESNSVFKQTELPTLLNNSKITSIDGIPITELKAVFNNAGGASGNGLGEKSRETY